jgi:hypothetical protein
MLRSSNPAQKDWFHRSQGWAKGALTSNKQGQSTCTAFEERSISRGGLHG